MSIGPRVHKSPFFDATVRDGVTHFSIYNHMYMPTSYGDPEGEYWRLIEAASMWDVAAQRQVEISGPDAGVLVDILSARDVTSARVGQAKYMPMCDHEGRLINDPLVLRVAEDRWWISIADGDMLLWCRAIAFERGPDVRVEEPDVSPLAVQGPRAEDVVARLIGEWIRDIRFFEYRPADVDGIPLWVGRAGWSRQGGFELYLCDHTRGVELWDRVAEAGRPFGIGPGAPNYIERVESALLSYRADTEWDTNPLEAGLDRWLDLDRDTDFIGKQALVGVRERGPRRRLIGLFIDGAAIEPNGHPWPTLHDGVEVGRVRAAAHSPRLRRNIALALLRADLSAPGTGVTVMTEWGDERPATVTTTPFIP